MTDTPRKQKKKAAPPAIVVRRVVSYYAGPEDRVEDMRSCGWGATREDAIKDWICELGAMQAFSKRGAWAPEIRQAKRLIRANRMKPVPLWKPPRRKRNADDDIPF